MHGAQLPANIVSVFVLYYFTWSDMHILTDVTVVANSCIPHNMAKMPNSGIVSNFCAPI